jgi:hypothetical protein
MIGVLGFDSQRGLGIFFFITASRMALGSTQPPIKWVRGALSLGVKRPVREADHSPPSSAEVKEWVELYLHSLNTPPWHSAQLKQRDNFTFYHILVSITCAWNVVFCVFNDWKCHLWCMISKHIKNVPLYPFTGLSSLWRASTAHAGQRSGPSHRPLDGVDGRFCCDIRNKRQVAFRATSS